MVKHKILLLLLVGSLLLSTGLIVLAQSGGGYDLTWNTVDGGGGSSAGSGYTLNGTVGQPDAGMLAGGGYTLGGGFWMGGATVANIYKVYLPSILRNYP